MKKTGIAIAVLLAVGGVATGGAWYTGQQLEGVLRNAVDKGNAQLTEFLPDENVKIELVSFERGFFTSDARYRVTWATANDAGEQPEILIGEKLEHGPFPLSRVLKLKLLPVMAVSSGELERNSFVEPVFKLVADGVKPIETYSALGYDGSIVGDVTLAPVNYNDAEGAVTFSGLKLNYETSKNAEKIKVDGQIDKFTWVAPEQESLELTDLRLESDRTIGASGFYTGGGVLSIERAAVEMGEGKALAFNNIVQRDQTTEKSDALAGTLNYEIGSIQFNGQTLGSMTMDWSIADFDVAALKVLSDNYEEFSERLQKDPYAELSDQEEKALTEGFEALLAGKPKIALDNFGFKTPNGQADMSLKLAFNKPESFELPPEQLWQQLLTNLDLRVAVDKSLISDVLGYRALFEPELDPKEVAAEAAMMSEMAVQMAAGMQLAKVDSGKLVSTLTYADNTVNFNGQEMPVESFIMMMAMLAPAGMNETDAEQGYDEDAEVIEYAEDDEAEVEEPEEGEEGTSITNSLKGASE